MPTRKSLHPSLWKEVSDRNFLSVIGFKFVLERCPKVDFYCNAANLPSITLGVAEQPSYLRNIPVPGDKIQFEDLQISFMVDEHMENYLEIYDWITGLGFPESIDQYIQLGDDKKLAPENDPNDNFNERSDATLMILNSDYNTSVKVKFRDLFPIELSGIPFDAKAEQQEYYTATARFKYTMFDVIDVDGKKV
jgi:hypothetical protein|tara:strand:- start:1544 stop:2122 length:579 start_codon:yes stop_codon:yes gene_type:complete